MNDEEEYEDVISQFEREMEDTVYRGSDVDYWWYDVSQEENSKYIKPFLMILAVNPVWSNSLFHKDSQAGCVGFCPFHKRLLTYYCDMNINKFLTDYKIVNCESSGKMTGKFIGDHALRQHLSCQGDL